MIVFMEDVEYYRYAIKDSKKLFNYFFENTAWHEGYYEVADMKIKYPRLMCWYGLEDSWPALLIELKAFVEHMTQTEFNAALLNLYRNGNDSVGYHSDKEVTSYKNPVIASLSLGAPRKFMIKNKKTKREVMFVLESGDVLIMKGNFQKN